MPDRTGPDVAGLFALFPPESYLRGYDQVPAEQVPQPYHKLLVHDQHMTVTVEEHHGDLVDVVVLEERLLGDSYARKILLALQHSRRIVQFGLMRVHFKYCSEAVKQEILSRKTPLGRILIEHNVLRRIEATAFLRVVPGPDMMTWFGLAGPTPTYGRAALIHCDNQPAVELLEIVAP
jgi:chorismate-pyruvate lyase